MKSDRFTELRNQIIAEACKTGYPCILAHGNDDFWEIVHSLCLNDPAMQANILFLKRCLKNNPPQIGGTSSEAVEENKPGRVPVFSFLLRLFPWLEGSDIWRRLCRGYSRRMRS